MSSSSKTPTDDSEAAARYLAICSKALLLPPGQQAQFLRDLDRSNAVEEHIIIPADRMGKDVVLQEPAAPPTRSTSQDVEPIEETQQGVSTGTARTASPTIFQWIQCIPNADEQPSTPPAEGQQATAAPQHGTGAGQNTTREIADTSREHSPSAEQHPQTPSTVRTDPMSIHAVLEQNTSSPG